MVARKKKGEAGEANRYIARNKAVRKLQLDLHSFNRVCIIKNIFPIEPKNRIKAQKGDSKYRPLYLKKDIRFLQHDPLIWTIRKEQALQKKLRSANHKRDGTKIAQIRRSKPIYDLQQNVLERYPTFVDAVKDLADPLGMIFMMSSIKVYKPIQPYHVSRCQRLRMEFLTYIIKAKCLSKAFITTKGYYYEAEVMGQRVVWLAPHSCVTEVPRNANMKIMRHFLEFYISMLGFINFRLLGKVNLRYPLKPAHIPKQENPKERKDLDHFKNLMQSLNYPLERTQSTQNEEEDIDSHLIEGSTEKTQKAYTENMQAVHRRKLFSGLKFFISQENNRESLTLVIRSCGGEVSWPSSLFPCSTYTEDDQSITHQIVDRPNFEKKYITRYYVQPQWLYDSLNSVTLQPVQLYLPDAELPPHVCPFLKNYEGWYVPPEEETLRKLLEASPEEKEMILRDMMQKEQDKLAMIRSVKNLSSDEEDDDEDDEEEEEEEDEDAEIEEDSLNREDAKGSVRRDHVEEAEESMEEDEVEEKEDKSGEDNAADESDEEELQNSAANEVSRGKERMIRDKNDLKKELHNDYKMRAFMIPRANRKLYRKMKSKEGRQERRSLQLKDRREAIEKFKVGKITQEALDVAGKRTAPLDMQEKKARAHRKNIKSALDFAKSKANKHRNN